MLSFKEPKDIQKLSPDDPAHPVIKELIEDLISAYTWEGHPYNPDWYRPCLSLWLSVFNIYY
jgi:hypothetical protein